MIISHWEDSLKVLTAVPAGPKHRQIEHHEVFFIVLLI